MSDCETDMSGRGAQAGRARQLPQQQDFMTAAVLVRMLMRYTNVQTVTTR
jgi:hypothetical protein